MYKLIEIATVSFLVVFAAVLVTKQLYYDTDATNVHYGRPYKQWKYENGAFHKDFWGLPNVDAERNELIKGKTKEAISKKFGFIRERQNPNEYQKGYNDVYPDKEIIWLGNSAWLVLMENGQGTTMKLVKG